MSTDAVSQITLLTTGLLSSNSAANLTSAMSQTLALSYQNAVANQQQAYMIHQSSGVQGRNSMFATSLSAGNAIIKNIESE